MGVDQNPDSGDPALTCDSKPSEIVEVLVGESDDAESPFQDKNPHSTSGEDAVSETAGKGLYQRFQIQHLLQKLNVGFYLEMAIQHHRFLQQGPQLFLRVLNHKLTLDLHYQDFDLHP